MDFEQLNMYYFRYRREPSSITFADVYREARRLFLRLHRSKMRSAGYRDQDDADCVFHDVIMRQVDRELDDLGKPLATALNNARIDYYRKEQTRAKYFDNSVSVEPRDYDEDASTSYVEAVSLNDEYEFTRKKNAKDQRQLISRILESVKIHFDSITVVAVEGILSDPITVVAVNEIMSGASVQAVATALGLQRNTIDRKILRLGRFLPKDCIIHEFLPEGYSVKREYVAAS